MINISIAMATYNGFYHLPEQLKSFCAQSILPDELVVCDDGSTDGTPELLEEFRRSAPFNVRVVRNSENVGHERNFAQAVDLCEGEIIFLADQDDRWLPEKLETVERLFSSDPTALLVVNDALITDEELNPIGRTVLGQLKAAGVLGTNSKSLTLGCATAFRNRLKQLVCPIPALDYGHDSWIHDFTEVVGGRRVLPKVLQLYRRHGDNASTWAFNGSARASPLVMMRPSAGRDLTPEYAKRLRALSLMRERVQGLGGVEFARIGADKAYASVLGDLDRAVAAVERRSGIFQRGWLGRKLVALRLLFSGDYRYFLGWRSFVKDLVR